jgi:two-component system sensor histidine kinase EvgS
MSDSTTSSTAREPYSELISLAVHEFRTPASVIGGYLRMLQGDSTLNERQRKMVDEAHKSCARLVEIIAELSVLGKFEDGAIHLARTPLDLFALAAEVAGHVQEARDRGVRLEVRGEKAGAEIKGDVTQLRTAIDAIFRAILREQSSDATVVAECRRERRDGRSAAVLIVTHEDSVAAAYDSRVGALFQKHGGLGLALPIALRVIEALGGEIWSPAEPEPLQRGAILVRFPLTE